MSEYRARLSWRIYASTLLSYTPASIAAGSIITQLTEPQAGTLEYLRGALNGGLIASILVTFEIFALQRGRLAHAPFLVYLTVRSLIYLAVILGVLAVAAWLLPSPNDSLGLLTDIVPVSIVVSFGFNAVAAVNRLLGPGVLVAFVAGRYHRPRREERVLLFIDLADSTGTAEELGEVAFLTFLNGFIGDVGAAIAAQRGEIYKYIGDEIIATWKLAAGVKNARSVRACFDAMERLAAHDAAYQRDFGRRPRFRAALHCGPVVVGELGSIRLEVALIGETMNTAARVEQACRDTGHDVLASAALIDRIADLPPGIAKRSLGPVKLRGKATELELFALTRER
jgi:adenylate cyclase